MSSTVLTKEVAKKLDELKKLKIYIPSSKLIKKGFDIFGKKIK